MNASRVLLEWRRRAGLTQAALAEAVGTRQPVVARIERGMVVPRVDTLTAMLRACGATIIAEPTRRGSTDPSHLEVHDDPAERLRTIRAPGFSPSRMLRLLMARHLEFVLIGNIAARVLGAPVEVADVEIAVNGERGVRTRFRRALEVLKVEGAERLTRAARLTLQTTHGRLRVRTLPPAVYRPVLAASRIVERGKESRYLEPRHIRVASVDDLIRLERSPDRLDLLWALRDALDS